MYQLNLSYSTNVAALLPQLGRLLTNDDASLQRLAMSFSPLTFHDAPHTALFCDVLRRNKTLLKLELCRVDLTHSAADALRAAVAACSADAAVCALDMRAF